MAALCMQMMFPMHFVAVGFEKLLFFLKMKSPADERSERIRINKVQFDA